MFKTQLILNMVDDPSEFVFNYHVENAGDKVYLLRPVMIGSDGKENNAGMRIKDLTGDIVETRDEYINQTDKASEVGWTDPFGTAYIVTAVTTTQN